MSPLSAPPSPAPWVSGEVGIAGYSDVDAATDPSRLFSRLDGHARCFAPMIEQSIRLLRLRKGQAVIDVGCGNGTAIARLANAVGPGGLVAAIDSSEAMVAETSKRFSDSGHPLDVRRADARALPFCTGAFHAVRCDRVLLFVDDPRKALLEMQRVTRVGGRIVVSEGDLGSHCIDADDLGTTRSLMDTISDRLPNACSGRRLPALFAAIGLRDIHVELVPYFSRSYDEWNGRMALAGAVTEAVRSGRVDDRRGDRWLQDLQERDACGRFFASCTFFIVAGTR